MGTIIDKLKLTLGTKNAIREAIISMGQAVPETLKFSGYPEKIRAIRTGVETDDATAGAGDILSGKTAYVKGEKVTGTIQSQGTKVITPGTIDQTAVAQGMFTSGAVTVQGDANLIAENIKEGVRIFGVDGLASTVKDCKVTTNVRSTVNKFTFRFIATDVLGQGYHGIEVNPGNSSQFSVLKGSMFFFDWSTPDSSRQCLIDFNTPGKRPESLHSIAQYYYDFVGKALYGCGFVGIFLDDTTLDIY